jgi:IS30 family transposase
MRNHYQQLQAEERATIMVMQQQSQSIRQIAHALHRSPSSISRELRRNSGADSRAYDPVHASRRARLAARTARTVRKLDLASPLFGVVTHFLHQRWSPQQIGGTLRRMYPNDPSQRVSHETIYTALYAMPRGELRRELIACLRQSNDTRRPRSRGTDRRGGIPEMQSLHIRPPEVADRLIPGHWEADLIKGAFNRSAVGTLVERTTRLVILARMPDASAASALAGFTAALNKVAEPLRKTMTYDQGREMSRHRELTAHTGVAVYFCDPHSPWQRGSNENTNGLLRQYMPKGTDLSQLTQGDLDAIAYQMNTRPRKVLDYRSPLEVYGEIIDNMKQAESATIH